MHHPKLGEFLLDAEAGVLSVSEVVSWADAFIEANTEPAVEVIDLSLMANQPVDNVEAALRRMYDGDFNIPMVARTLLKIVNRANQSGDLLGANQSFWKILMQDMVKLPPLIRDALYLYDDRCDYLGEGIIHSQEVRDVLDEIQNWAHAQAVAA